MSPSDHGQAPTDNLVHALQPSAETTTDRELAGAVIELERQVQEVVDRETRAWDTQDAQLLLSIFHADMVWPWPPTPNSHDPQSWVWGMGRFDSERWRSSWEELFATHELIHNHRRTVRISISPERDGAFAVVDVDTLWRHRDNGTDQHWKGRACKLYTLLADEWKLIGHTGLLDYH